MNQKTESNPLPIHEITVSIKKYMDASLVDAEDILAIEEPLQISLSFFEKSIHTQQNISVTMRTPGNDEELAAGFLFTEGIISDAEQISSIESFAENSVTVFLKDEVQFDMGKLNRNFYTTSSCGVCGKSSIDAIKTESKYSNTNHFSIDSSLLLTLPDVLKTKQEVFKKTGGLHASALFDSKGEILIVREDVGRHNALDKLIGHEFLANRIPLSGYMLLLSGRASFELMQKAYMAGINFVAAVGAPSSLAVEFAVEKKMTLVGFLKGGRFNIYNGKIE